MEDLGVDRTELTIHHKGTTAWKEVRCFHPVQERDKQRDIKSTVLTARDFRLPPR
jgi:hypothetical protein